MTSSGTGEPWATEMNLFDLIFLAIFGGGGALIGARIWSMPGAVLGAILGAGVYYMIHYMVGVPFLVFLSELLGGFVVFGGGWMVLVSILERRQEHKTDARRLPP